MTGLSNVSSEGKLVDDDSAVPSSNVVDENSNLGGGGPSTSYNAPQSYVIINQNLDLVESSEGVEAKEEGKAQSPPPPPRSPTPPPEPSVPVGNTSVSGDTTRGEPETLVDQVDRLFSRSPSLKESLDGFERKFARPCARTVLGAVGVPSYVVNYIETPVTLGVLLSSVYFTFAGSMASLKASVALVALLTYHMTVHSIALAFRLSRVALSTLFTFLAISVVFISAKVFITITIQGLTLISRVSAWRPEDWTNYISHIQQQLSNARNTLANLDWDTLRDAAQHPRLQEFHTRYIVNSQWRAWFARVQWKEWVRFVVKNTFRASLVALLFFRWTGRAVVVSLLFGGWIFKSCRACCRPRRARRRQSGPHLHAE